VDFGQGVRVVRIAGSSGGVVSVEVEVDKDAPVGPRDVFVAGASRAGAAVVYDTVSGLRVSPAWGMARVGGIQMPKRLQQFEAIALSNGPDAKPGTKDDLDLGLVDASWSLEEYDVTFKDDDKRYVGEISATGLFTPAGDGPNPKRSGNRNNVGDVWVVATVGKDSPLKPGKLLRARAHLVVTVPIYVRWDQPEVAQ
jgi:quinohemoprotein amine dehydrogenase